MPKNCNNYSLVSISLIFLTRFTTGPLVLSGTTIDCWHIPWTKGMRLSVPTVTWGFRKKVDMSLFSSVCMCPLSTHMHSRRVLYGMLVVIDISWICKVHPQESVCFFPVARSQNLHWKELWQLLYQQRTSCCCSGSEVSFQGPTSVVWDNFWATFVLMRETVEID